LLNPQIKLNSLIEVFYRSFVSLHIAVGETALVASCCLFFYRKSLVVRLDGPFILPQCKKPVTQMVKLSFDTPKPELIKFPLFYFLFTRLSISPMKNSAILCAAFFNASPSASSSVAPNPFSVTFLLVIIFSVPSSITFALIFP